MFCFHKYGKRQKDGYQYCSKCGKAHRVPCNHKWNLTEQISCYFFNDLDHYVNVYECENCGKMKKKRI
jgi:Fe2+ or Zn2+ uptake regulation protein